MARIGHTKVIYKGTFVCKQTLPVSYTVRAQKKTRFLYSLPQFSLGFIFVTDNLCTKQEILQFLGLKSAFKKCFWEICCNLQCPVHISITWIYFLKNSLVLGTFLLRFAGGILSNRSCHKRLTRHGLRTTQRGNSLHCTAENSLPLPNV